MSRNLSIDMRGAPPTEWTEYESYFRKTLTDGTEASGPLMRRSVGGVWQYRRMTEPEMKEYVSAWAW